MSEENSELRLSLDLGPEILDREALESLLSQVVEASGGRAGFLTTRDARLSTYGLDEELVESLRSLLGDTEGAEPLARVEESVRDARLRAGLGRLHAVAIPVRARGRDLGVLCLLHPSDVPRFLRDSPGLYNLVIDRVEVVVESARLLHFLLQERRWLEAVVRHSSDGVAILDAQSRVVGFNDAMERLSGWSVDQAVGRPGHEVFPLAVGPRAEPSTALAARVQSLLRETSEPVEGVLTCRDGRRIDVEISGVTVRDRRGAMLGWVMSLRDIRRRKDMERLGKIFLSAVSHELQTPLAIIKGFSGLMADPEVELSPKQIREKAEVIHQESRRLERMVRQMLRATSIQAGGVRLRLEPVDLGGLVRRIALRLEPVAREAHSRITVEVEGEVPPVEADEGCLEQVVTNLVENALKHSPGGQVDLRVSADPREVRVSVTDRGPGVPEAERERIFRPFERGRTPHRGTGLGLFICKALVEAHRGRIGVENTPQGGARFYFTLPRALT